MGVSPNSSDYVFINAEVVKAKGPAWWDTFGEFLEREIDGYNDSFRSDTPRQLKCSRADFETGRTYTVENSLLPHVVLNITFNGSVVSCVYRTTKESMGKTTEDSLHLDLSVGENGMLSLTYKGQPQSEDQILELILDRLLPATD